MQEIFRDGLLRGVGRDRNLQQFHICEVWELQRRLTLFHEDWHAPFLPHDGQLCWRWVDGQFYRHPWLRGDEKSCASADVPPIEPPSGWVAQGSGWAIVTDVASACDEQGWSYAMDFFVSAQMWGNPPAACHCRRRCWRCFFVVEDETEEHLGLSQKSSSQHIQSTPSGLTRRASSKEAPQIESHPDSIQWPNVLDLRDAEKDMAPVFEGYVPTLQLDVEVDGLFSEQWDPHDSVLMAMLETHGGTDLAVGPWMSISVPGANRSGARAVTARFPVPPRPFTPPTTRATVNIRIATTADENGKHTAAFVAIDYVMHDVMYGNCFSVREQTTFTSTEHGLHVERVCCVPFLKPTMMQSVIEAAALDQQRKEGAKDLDLLHRRGGVCPEAAPLEQVVHMWELQRRITLFHTEWIAPFLPHDGEKQRRWVIVKDGRYRRHPWTTGSHAECAELDTPAIEPPSGWELSAEGWVVQTAADDCDEHGWQHAVDFYVSDDLWRQSPFAMHCRRRLWIGRYTFARELPPIPMSARQSQQSVRPPPPSCWACITKLCDIGLSIPIFAPFRKRLEEDDDGEGEASI